MVWVEFKNGLSNAVSHSSPLFAWLSPLVNFTRASSWPIINILFVDSILWIKMDIITKEYKSPLKDHLQQTSKQSNFEYCARQFRYQYQPVKMNYQIQIQNHWCVTRPGIIPSKHILHESLVRPRQVFLRTLTYWSQIELIQWFLMNIWQIAGKEKDRLHCEIYYKKFIQTFFPKMLHQFCSLR